MGRCVDQEVSNQYALVRSFAKEDVALRSRVPAKPRLGLRKASIKERDRAIRSVGYIAGLLNNAIFRVIITTSMKFVEPRPFADPEAAARKLL
jgi:hypothetical protein